MLFRTKFVIGFFALAAVAIGSAALLILSSQRNELNQTRTDLAHESLSGYFQLSGSVFRTFKQARRDLLSRGGTFAFDFAQSARDIQDNLDRIEETSLAEAALLDTDRNLASLEALAVLRTEVTQALEGIEAASQLIVQGAIEEGRQQAVMILEGQVDVRIATLIELATTAERLELAAAQQEIRAFQDWTEKVAWLAVLTAIVLSVLILVTLLRRFQTGLRALEQGARAFSANDLDYEIDLPGQDELSDVANRFTEMARQIQLKQRALEKARLDLEHRVGARTAELSAANSELRESDALRRQFFADIGHELRTPVTAIRGEAEVALRAKTGQAEAHVAALNTIVSLSEELTSNVSDLFLIAREQAGVLDFRATALDLSLAVGVGIEQMQSLKVQKGATISANLSKAPITIQGDSSRIAQLVRLLISNALEHGHAQVRIAVSTYVDQGDAVLEVSDDGPGIPEKDRPRIFDRFVRGKRSAEASGSASVAGSGTGLGLAIAKSITQAHGGAIMVTEGTQGGACFIARFPRVEPS